MEIPITIRQATLSDLEEMLVIEEANPSLEEALSRQSLEESIRKTAGTFLVAGDENQLLGYVLGEAQSIHPKWLEIKSLTIHPYHWGQGLGTLLLAALKEVAVELDYKGIRLKSPDELLSYFEMNGFIDEETSLYATSQGFSMIWFNPFYLEAQ